MAGHGWDDQGDGGMSDEREIAIGFAIIAAGLMTAITGIAALCGVAVAVVVGGIALVVVGIAWLMR